MSPNTLLSFTLLLLSTAASAATTPVGFLLPIIKDRARLQYYTTFTLGIPPVRVYLSVDLGNPYNWLVGDLAGYNQSTSYKPVYHNTSDCRSFAGVLGSSMDHCPFQPSPTCNNHQCIGWASNPRRLDLINHGDAYGLDPVVSPLYRLRRRKATSLSRFPFVDTVARGPLRGLSLVSKGILTLSKNPIAIHRRISTQFKAPHRFALCLPSSNALNGAVYFGGGPYLLPPSAADLSTSLAFTPIVSNAHSFLEPYEPADPAVEYYVNVTSIKIDSGPVDFNSSLLSIDGRGDGGAKLSTFVPYTTLHSEIYAAFVAVFVGKAKARNMRVAGPMSSFKTCFDSKSIRYDAKTGSGVPVIELVMEGGATWKIYGSNSMVKVSSDVQCLAIFDAGPKPSQGVNPTIVIGGKQMEDNLVEFDLEASKVGITSSLLRLGTSCSQFDQGDLI